jgi:hypothetical protein
MLLRFDATVDAVAAALSRKACTQRVTGHVAEWSLSAGSGLVANVAQIFISYSSKHRELTRTLAAAIGHEHLSGKQLYEVVSAHGGKAPNSGSCEGRSTLRVFGATKASPPKPVIYSHRFTDGSPRALTRGSCKTPRRCSTTWHDAKFGEIPVRRWRGTTIKPHAHPLLIRRAAMGQIEKNSVRAHRVWLAPDRRA